MRLGKPQVLLRRIHHWGAIVIALPVVVMIAAGLLLQLKKDVGWIQPPTREGSSLEVPTASLAELFAAARAVPQAEISSWQDLERVDYKPDKGIVKFIAKSRWEVQLDSSTAEVLQVAYRRSDLIETIHDGTFFAEGAKLFIFLPAGIVLFVLWCTGIYMFFYPVYKRRKRRRQKAEQVSGPDRK